MTERIRQNVIIPQVNEPLGLVDGKPVFPTTAWHQYFDGLWKRTGGFSDGLLEEIIRSFVETSENRAAIEAVTGLVRSLEALSQSNAEDARQAVEEAFARLRRVEDNLRAEVEATLASLGELSKLDAAQRNNIALGAIGNRGLGFDASHNIRSIPSALPVNTASYNSLTLRTNFFIIPPSSITSISASYRFRAPSDLFSWFYYKYALRIEAETVGGTQTLASAPVATGRKAAEGWVSGNMVSANYERVEQFSLNYQLDDADITAVSGTGRYRIALDLEPDDSVETRCVEGWGDTVTGTFSWDSVSLQAIAFNDGPFRS